MAAQQAEQAHLERLQQVIRVPLDQDYPDWSSLGWLQAPLMLKLGGAVMTNGHIPNGKEGLWGKMSAWLRRGLENGNFQKGDKYSTEIYENPEDRFLEHLDQAVPEEPTLYPPESGITIQPTDSVTTTNPTTTSTQHSLVGRPKVKNPLPQSGKIAGPTMSVYMLGDFRLVVDDVALDQPLSGRSGALLKYLIHNHKRRIPRDELMEVFWPGIEPESARNRLNVTLNKIRNVLRNTSNQEIILFEVDKYFLNPEMQIWIDVDQFENLLAEARRLEEIDKADRAIRSLEMAANLYQGDFLTGDIYEEWTVLTRERLRLANLDALYQLSQTYFNRGDYSDSADLCQLILNRDNCREDAHRRLMRCYSRLGKRHLALRQFQLCEEALQNELDIDPEPATIQLVERIRSQEAI